MPTDTRPSSRLDLLVYYHDAPFAESSTRQNCYRLLQNSDNSHHLLLDLNQHSKNGSHINNWAYSRHRQRGIRGDRQLHHEKALAEIQRAIWTCMHLNKYSSLSVTVMIGVLLTAQRISTAIRSTEVDERYPRNALWRLGPQSRGRTALSLPR